MIRKTFQQKQPFIGFITGGDGGIDYCVECCLQLIEGGVDILEIGFPFSDPVADGAVIQSSSQRSIAKETNAKAMLEIARRIRSKTNIPLVLFSYYNTLLSCGDTFLYQAKTAGYDAVLIVDLPPFIADNTLHSYYQSVKEAYLYPIFVIAPSSSQERVNKIAAISEGFIYYACQKGTTGTKEHLPDDLIQHITRIKQTTSVPVAVGFGISNRTNACTVLTVADGFVVGSAFVKCMETKSHPSKLKKLAQDIDPRHSIRAY
jgi:tryptophan synthase alpha chain